MNEWKVAIYREIIEAYERMMTAYDGHITRLAPDSRQMNPLLLNNIERSALQTACMDMLRSLIVEKSGNPPVIYPPVNTVNARRYTQFFEEAFEWNEMTWHFNEQPSRLSYALQGKNDSLRPFLLADTANLFLPVRPEYNFQVLYYLSSGIVCPSFYPFVPVNSSDAPVAIHLKRIDHWHECRRIEKCWDITLPTTMQVIDDNSELPDFFHLKK